MIADIFNLVISLAMFVIFFRFMVQFSGMGPSNPFVKPLYQATQVVDLFSSIFPTVGRGHISLSAIALLFLFRLIEISGNVSFGGFILSANTLILRGGGLLMPEGGLTLLALLAGTVFSLIIDFFIACQYLIVIAIVISWIVVLTGSMHPILATIMHLAEPLLAPFRRVVPNIGPIDLSAIVAIFVFGLMAKGVFEVANYILPLVV